jgi:hypothetical protein
MYLKRDAILSFFIRYLIIPNSLFLTRHPKALRIHSRFLRSISPDFGHSEAIPSHAILRFTLDKVFQLYDGDCLQFVTRIEIMSDGKVTMQFGAAQFSAEGTENFINSMFEKWTAMLSDSKSSAFAEPATGTSLDNGTKNSTSGGTLNSYENVYDEIDGKIKIIAHMPGSNKADRTRNTALALMFGNHVKGQSTTSSDEIREHCLDQGCLDSSNFASHLKGFKDKIAMNTKTGGGYDVKLTAPGRKAAQSLVEKLNNESA